MTAKTLKSEAARQQWGEILDMARAGQEVVIERYNKPVAILIGYQEHERIKQAFALMLKFIQGDSSAEELDDLLAEIIAHRRIQEYLTNPSVAIPYEEFRRRMVDEGILDE
jgi:prevent-host-death family protein